MGGWGRVSASRGHSTIRRIRVSCWLCCGLCNGQRHHRGRQWPTAAAAAAAAVVASDKVHKPLPLFDCRRLQALCISLRANKHPLPQCCRSPYIEQRCLVSLVGRNRKSRSRAPVEIGRPRSIDRPVTMTEPIEPPAVDVILKVARIRSCVFAHYI